jgi:predicted GH43/DUF377 family glycosyl hydrolase
VVSPDAGTALVHRVDAELLPDPARVVARLFLPGEENRVVRSRSSQILDRVMALDDDVVERVASGVVADFGDRHRDLPALLERHASIVDDDRGGPVPLSAGRRLVLGATFTAEYAVEAAALCNPSTVPHPDQTGLSDGQMRVAISLRGIGEGHISSIGFVGAVVGPGAAFAFEPRARPTVAGIAGRATWTRTQFRAVLAQDAALDELRTAVLRLLPADFDADGLERALSRVHHDLLVRPGAAETVALLRRVVASAYRVEFDADCVLSQQVLMPSAPDESNGMEDARFTLFVDDDGTVEYRATYTAYDGRKIAPCLLTSPDLRTFTAHRLTGAAARNKGMALFPRRVGGRHLALCRSDGENTALTSSTDGFVWESPQPVQHPEAWWELLQIGNCGPPIETSAGWLVITHGVGPMRVYSLGAVLLDLDDPTRIVARLEEPLLRPSPDGQDGYVPNVVYSCGGVLHDGRVWLPYGISDTRIGVAWVDVDELLAAMTPAP